MAFNVFMMRSTIFYDVKGKDRWGWILTTSDPSSDLKIVRFPTKKKNFKAVSVARKYLRQKMREKRIVYTSFTGFVGAVLIIIRVLGSIDEWEDAIEMSKSALSSDVRDIIAGAEDAVLSDSIRKLE